MKARLAYCNANSIQSGPAQLTPGSSSFLKATEPARLLPLLVPALSEAKGWHQQQEMGTCSKEQEQASLPIQEGFLEEELMSLNFDQILE